MSFSHCKLFITIAILTLVNIGNCADPIEPGPRNNNTLKPGVEQLYNEFRSHQIHYEKFYTAVGAIFGHIERSLSNLQESVRDLNVTQQGLLQRMKNVPADIKEEWRKERINGVLKQPVVRLYYGENLRGKFEDYTLSQKITSSRCYRLKSGITLIGKIKSIETFGTCVRLFTACCCEGESLAFYPGAELTHSRETARALSLLGSLGHCSEIEFENATVLPSPRQGYEVKKRESPRRFPDIFNFSGWEDRELIKYGVGFPNSSFIFGRYLLGYRGRTEYLNVVLDARNLVNVTKTTNNDADEDVPTNWSEFDRHPGDVPGYGIPLLFSGPRMQFNIFPQTRSSMSEWKGITTAFVPFLLRLNPKKKYPQASMSVHFMYENDKSTQPFAFGYHLQILKGGEVIYGFVKNY